MTQRTCRKCGAVIRGRPSNAPTEYCRQCRPRSGKHASCGYCGKPSGGQRFCTALCQEIASWERRQAPIAIAPHPCKHCGQPFARRSNSTSAYCSPEHKAIAWKRQQQAHSAQRDHAAIYAARRGYHQQRYATQRLLRTAQILAAWQTPHVRPQLEPGPARTCQECDGPTRTKYCSPNCSAQAKLRQDRNKNRREAVARTTQSRRWTAGECHECSQPFAYLGRAHHRFCSPFCAKRNRRRRDKKLRSKRIKAGARRETIDLAVLAQRDGWRCHLCKRKVTRRNWSHDHLIPLSHGGDHTYDNVALAHTLCNSKRGTGGEPQLLLVG